MSVLTKLSADAYDELAFQAFSAQREFSRGTAKAMMWLSQLSYETDEPDKIAAMLRRWGVDPIGSGVVSRGAASPLPIARTEAIVARNEDVAFLAFAGTDPLVLANWIADFDIRPQDDGTTAGFSQALEPVLPALCETFAPDGPPVVVTGHSLGGALAVLAALSLADRGVPVTAVYTFGMPRPGGETFRARYDERLGASTFRLVHGDDLVPTVAPSSLGFRHVGRLLRCRSGERFGADVVLRAGETDEPAFDAALTHSLLNRVLLPWGDWPVVGRDNGDGAALPSWGGRPDLVKLLIELLPRRIREHLPESYLAALG